MSSTSPEEGTIAKSATEAEIDAKEHAVSQLPQFKLNTSLLDPYFTNMSKLLDIGSIRPLVQKDLGPLPKDIGVAEVVTLFDKYWEEECNTVPIKEKRSLWRVLRKVCGSGNMLFAYFLYAMAVASNYAIPELSNAIAKHQSGLVPQPEPVYHLFVALIFILPSLGTICKTRSEFNFGKYPFI